MTLTFMINIIKSRVLFRDIQGQDWTASSFLVGSLSTDPKYLPK